MFEDYQLICMSVDGNYVNDCAGTLEECRNASANMGSKWIFYPFHFILSKTRFTVIDTGCGLVRMSDKKAFMELMFKNRRFSTVYNAFKEASDYIEREEIMLNDCYDFENVLINRNQKLIRSV